MARMHQCDRCANPMKENEIGADIRVIERGEPNAQMMREEVVTSEGRKRDPRVVTQEWCRSCVSDVFGWDFNDVK